MERSSVTTTLFLVRHAAHALLGRILAGRMADVHLDANGQAQARRLGLRLASEALTSVQSSPRERALETAAQIAERSGVTVEVVDAADEIDFGEWTGRTFDELARDIRWSEWNIRRASGRSPGGESMTQAQSRFVGHLGQLSHSQAGGRVAIVSHCDLIKAALLHYLDVSLDHFARIEIAPASISAIAFGDWGVKLLSMNEVAAT